MEVGLDRGMMDVLFRVRYKGGLKSMCVIFLDLNGKYVVLERG